MAHFTLVHGGVHDSSCWAEIDGPLRSRGHLVDLVDLPGRARAERPTVEASLESYTDTVESAVRAAGEPVILVAHSMGAVSACLAVQRVHHLVSRMVLVNALPLRDGEAVLPILQTAIGADCYLMKEGVLVTDDSVATISSAEAGVDAFYNRCDPAVGRAAAARLCPEPLLPLVTPVRFDVDVLDGIPLTYIGSRDDRVIPWDFQHDRAEIFGAEFVELTADHTPLLSASEQLLAHLERAAA